MVEEEVTQNRRSIIVIKDTVFDLNECTDEQLRAIAAAVFSVQMKRSVAVRLQQKDMLKKVRKL